jgi:hypothetical protein
MQDRLVELSRGRSPRLARCGLIGFALKEVQREEIERVL